MILGLDMLSVGNFGRESCGRSGIGSLAVIVRLCNGLLCTLVEAAKEVGDVYLEMGAASEGGGRESDAGAASQLSGCRLSPRPA